MATATDIKPAAAADAQLQMRAPRHDADFAAVHGACAAAQARQFEVFDFAVEHRIPGLDNSDKEGARGEQLRAALASLPYVNKKLGVGEPYDPEQKIASLDRARRLNLDIAERAFLVMALNQRDALIDATIARVGRVAKIVTKLAPHTLAVQIDVDGREERYSGTSHTLVVLENPKGEKHALLLNYKTTSGAITAVQDNPRLAALAALADWNYGPFASLGVSAIGRLQDAEEIKLALYERPEIEAAQSKVVAITHSATRARRLYEEGRAVDGSLPDEVQDAIDETATVGDHCAQCSGAVCCRKLMVARGGAVMAATIDRQDEAKVQRQIVQATLKNLQPKPADTSGPNTENLMTPATLARTLSALDDLHTLMKPFVALSKDADELARQLVTNSKEKIPGFDGVSLKPGNARLLVRETITKDGVEQRCDTAPLTLLKALKPVLGDMSADQFVRDICEVNPVKVREAASIRGLVGEDFKQAVEAFGETGPLHYKPNAPSVVLDKELIKQPSQQTELPPAKNAGRKRRG